MRRIIYAVLALIIVANVAVAGNVAKGNPNPGILPPGSTPHGHTYDEWGDIWWQWAMSIPADVNPLADATGVNAGIGQSGSVWFLAGVSGIPCSSESQPCPVERTVTIPAGKALFFPIYNWLWINTPNIGEVPDPAWSPEEEARERKILADGIDEMADSLTCEIDGRQLSDLQSYRSVTPNGGAFMVTLPDGDLWGIVGIQLYTGTTQVVRPGLFGPSVQDGIFLMLAPLSAGQHTIHFTAGNAQDVTYHLIVVAGLSFNLVR
jgi:hypothetical protein